MLAQPTQPIAPPPSGAPAIAGVTLEQYAGVNAALIEGFSLAEVLRSEGLDAGAWPRVSLGWSRRLAKDGASGPLSASYRDTLGFARAWLGRRLAPLEDDLGAWLAFLNAWSAHPSPFEALEELSIAPSDVTRIQGAWAQRVEKDEELRKQAQEIAAKKPSAIPRVTVTRAVLRPFPWSAQRAVEVDSDAPLVKPKLSSSFIGDTFGLERYAALHAELGLAKKGGSPGAAAVLARQALDEASFADLAARWTRRFTIDPTLAQDFQRLVRYYEAKSKARSSKGEGSRAASVEAAAKAALVGTSLLLDVPRGPVTPFVEGATPILAASPPSEAPKVTRAPAELGGTSLLLDVPSGPVTPFEQKATEAREEATSAVFKLAGTSLLLDVPRGPVMPFVEGAASGVAARGKEVKGALEKAPASLGETSLLLDLPPLRAATPFEVPEEEKAASAAATAPGVPALTLQQHASMTVEIAMAPERALEVLQRYGLSPEEKRAVDAFWREKVAGDGRVREAWNQAYAEYHVWLTRRGER